MATRAKFRVQSKSYSYTDGGSGVQYDTVQLDAVTSVNDPTESEEEDHIFSDATPHGSISITAKSDAIAFMQPGQKVYVDISPAD